MPERIERKRTKGFRLPEGSVYVGRPSKWGNPFRVGDRYIWLGMTDMPFPMPTSRALGSYEHRIEVVECPDAATAVSWFEAWFGFQDRRYDGLDLAELKGKNLSCWCPVGTPCHGDRLLEWANR